ncbi:MAG: (Fe-S)-binding protein [Sulfolobaceae archaeon]
MEEGERPKCGGFKMEKGKIKISRQIVSRVIDEFTPEDIYGIENCMRCGICAYTCPFWLETRSSIDVPAWRTYEINKLYSMFYTGYGIVARFLRLRRIKGNEIKEWLDSAYNCTACGACTITSPMEIPNWYTALLLRRILHYAGFNYESAEKLAKNTKEFGNALGISKDEWLNIIKGMGLKYDKQADTLYVPSALEVKYKDTIKNTAEFLDKVNENWTLSSEISDVGYYAYFAGDVETARKSFMKIYEISKKLGIKRILVSDGTAFFMLRWHAPKSLRYKLDVEVYHVSDYAYKLYKDGKLKLSSVDIPLPATLHDSEFLSRMGGVEKSPREISKLLVNNINIPKFSPSSDKLFTCTHHLELINEKSDIVKRVRTYAVNQLSKLGNRSIITFDPNCRLSFENAVKDGQGNFKVIDFTEILNNGVVK